MCIRDRARPSWSWPDHRSRRAPPCAGPQDGRCRSAARPACRVRARSARSCRPCRRPSGARRARSCCAGPAATRLRPRKAAVRGPVAARRCPAARTVDRHPRPGSDPRPHSARRKDRQDRIARRRPRSRRPGSRTRCAVARAGAATSPARWHHRSRCRASGPAPAHAPRAGPNPACAPNRRPCCPVARCRCRGPRVPPVAAHQP